MLGTFQKMRKISIAQEDKLQRIIIAFIHVYVFLGISNLKL